MEPPPVDSTSGLAPKIATKIVLFSSFSRSVPLVKLVNGYDTGQRRKRFHLEAVVYAGRKSDAESDAATAQNPTQQAPARNRKESQDGIETDRLPGVITVSPVKPEVVYKRTVGGTGFEPVTSTV